MQIRKATTIDDIARAATIDEAVLGSKERADYIRSVAKHGGLTVALLQDEIQAFCCVDHKYFFEKPFISLLIVSPNSRQRGLGMGLLSYHSGAYPELWTSTNQSNFAMRKLLDKAGWHYCGALSGLDEDDPERFYKAA